MDSGSYIERLRNRTLFFANQLNPSQPKNFDAYDSLLDSTVGGFPIYVQYQAKDTDFLPSQPPPERAYSLDDAILFALNDILKYAATANLGPTKSSRFFYLWFFTMTAGYNWISSSGLISGTKDTWDWDTRYPLTNEQYQFIWMNQLLIDLMPSFVPGYDTSGLVANEVRALNLTTTQIQSLLTDIRTLGNWSLWKSRWDTWWTYRQNDGSVAAAAVPADSSLPNGTQTLEVTTTTDDPNTFTDPQKWVPLKINGSKKNYLTYGWNDVLSTVLTSAQETSIKNVCQTYFPGTASSWNDGSARANELQSLVQMNNGLTDEQKAIAEFWAGGPFTVSPPGMMIWLWSMYVNSQNTAHTKGFSLFLYSGFELAVSLFETARLVWGVKKTNMQARPIQEIRRLYRGQSLKKYDGTTILGEAWVPFQTSTFVTPPFPDFPSGHSAFSQTFANVMTKWFSAYLENQSFTFQTLNLLSPTFTGWQTHPYGTFSVIQGSSEIQPTVVPSSTIVLSWNSWQDIANSAGLSRQYGGIHCASAHTGSQALANELHSTLQTAWAIQ